MKERKDNFKRYSCLIGLILLLGQSFMVAEADVVIDSITQSPSNPVIFGDTVTYSLTVTNPASEPDVFVNISILLGLDAAPVTQFFTSSTVGCNQDGVFFCGQLLSGSTQTYVFSVVSSSILTSAPNELPFEFNVNCTQCQTASSIISPVTSVIAESVPTNAINISASAGASATGIFSIVELNTTTISALVGQVTPTTLPAGGGDVTYSLLVPAGSQPGDTLLDTITIVDGAGNRSEFPVVVTVSAGLAGSSGLTENELQVAETLDNACNALNQSESITGSQAKLLAICSALEGADSATTLSALQQLTPTQAPAQANLSVQSSNTQLNNVDARMSALRSGTSGHSVSGLTFNYGGLSLPANLFSTRQNNLLLGVNEDSNELSILPKLGVFINGNVSFGDKEDTVDELGFDFNTYGLTAGADYRLRDSLIVGGALGVVNTDSDFNHSQGNVDISGLSLLAYGTYFVNESTYLEGVISLGRNNFDNTRNVTVGTIKSVARGDTDGNEKTISFGAGYDVSEGATTLGSYVKINYIRAEIDGYTENSNSGLELTYQDQSSESLAMNVGGQLSYAISKDFGIILPTLRLDWTHEYKDDSSFITASFLNDPSQAEFTIQTDSPDSDYFQLGFGAAATFGSGRSAYFFYESILGKDNISQESLTGGLRIDF